MELSTDFDSGLSNNPKQEAMEAVGFLSACDTDVAKILRDALVYALGAPAPLFYLGRAAVLNPLIGWMRKHPDENVTWFRVIADARYEHGYDERVFSEDDAEEIGSLKEKRRTYMAGFMKAKRARESRAADIENMMRPESQRLVGEARKTYKARVAAGWAQRREERLSNLKAQGTTSLNALNEASKQFWDTIDRELDELEAKARKGK